MSVSYITHTTLSRTHQENDFDWNVSSNVDYPRTVDIHNVQLDGAGLVELTEEMLVRMLQEIRDPKMH